MPYGIKTYDHDGRARFITFCTHKRIPILTNDRYRKIVLDSIKHICKKYQLTLLASVIMPEHVHLVIVPSEEVKLGPLIGKMKHLSSFRIHKIMIETNTQLKDTLILKKDKREKFTLWQRRCYDHNCRDDKSVGEIVNYCHNNPVKRGLVSNPKDWRWSSYRKYNESQ
jgi:REP-associated tyrosine transposase